MMYSTDIADYVAFYKHTFYLFHGVFIDYVEFF